MCYTSYKSYGSLRSLKKRKTNYFYIKYGSKIGGYQMGYAVVHMMKIKSSGTRGMQSHKQQRTPHQKQTPILIFQKQKITTI